jgi:hypothetical protein
MHLVLEVSATKLSSFALISYGTGFELCSLGKNFCRCLRTPAKTSLFVLSVCVGGGGEKIKIIEIYDTHVSIICLCIRHNDCCGITSFRQNQTQNEP